MSSSNLIFISNKCIIFFNRVLFFLVKSLCLVYGSLGRTFIPILLMFLFVSAWLRLCLRLPSSNRRIHLLFCGIIPQILQTKLEDQLLNRAVIELRIIKADQ
ncbi:hypothetical protein KC19_VG120300 [Ceratodon purpureus]|uniref:Uncharacterized protein n=1 Tax=Ceratodon purpureus TaxID=3225 RepID=A0A8T0HPK0_CERPU|nr:hypothetical protein KC19_VG120300 [Ceratodon purpureus]